MSTNTTLTSNLNLTQRGSSSMITLYSQLAIATRTNKPVVVASDEFQSEIVKVATRYIDLYSRRYTDKDVCGLLELLPIVKNRFENLTVEGLLTGTISKPEDVSALLKGNAMMNCLEEKAIIEAYHNGVEEAAIYVYLFFSFKVCDFMSSSKLFGTDNEQDMYSSLQVYLYDIVAKFDFNIIQYGGLSTKYYRQVMCDYMRETLIGKNYSMFALNRRQVFELHKAQQITTHDSRSLSYDELAKKYNITTIAVSLHFIIMNRINIDSDGGSNTEKKTRDYAYCCCDKAFDAIEVPIKYSQMFVALEEKYIDKVVAKSILSSLLAYSEKSRLKSGYIKKASQKIYSNIAYEVGVPLVVVKKVINAFEKLFV